MRFRVTLRLVDPVPAFPPHLDLTSSFVGRNVKRNARNAEKRLAEKFSRRVLNVSY
jgi:hypothetical protein